MNTAERHYTGEQGRAYHQKKRALPEGAAPWVARLRAEKLQAQIGPSDIVFEFGAGFGWNLTALRSAERFASDLENLLGAEAREQGIRFVPQSNQLPDQFADVVICHHVLEHVANPPEVLAELRRLLKKSGRLLLFVPFEKEKRYRRFNPVEPNHHLYSWNVQTLGNLVTECGFSILSAGVGPFGYDRFAAKLAMRLKIGEAGFRAILRMAHLALPALEVRIVAGLRP